MKQLGTFQSKRWGTVSAYRSTYDGPTGPMAVVLLDSDGQRLATLSVNMYEPECSRDSHDLAADCFYVKTWGGNEDLAAEALASGLFVARADLPQAESGFVSAPVWQLVGSAA